MRLTKFGTTNLPELNGVDDFSQSARTNLVPLKYGAIDLDNSEVVLNYKQISRTAVINTDIDNTMDDLAYEGQKGARILKATMRNGDERQLLAKMSTFSRGAKAQNYTCEQEFGLQWTATYPYWLATEDEPYYTDHGYTTADGLSTADMNYHLEQLIVGHTTDSFTITNNSRVRIAKVNFTLSCSGNTSATMGGFAPTLIKILNNTNGMYVHVDAYISNANSGLGATPRATVDINCLTKTVTGNYPTNFYNHNKTNLYEYTKTNPDFMDWMILEPGDNNFTVSHGASGGGTSSITVFWSKHYV